MDDGALHVDNIDVFCEKGVYDVAQTRQILEKGKAAGMEINFHGEELNRLHSAEVGARLHISLVAIMIRGSTER